MAEKKKNEVLKFDTKAPNTRPGTPGNARTPAVLEYTLQVAQLGETANRDDPDDLWDHFMQYLKVCKETNVKPGNLGAYSAMGLSKKNVSDWSMGKNRVKDPRYAQLIFKVKSICGAYREAAMAEKDGINPLVGIWWQKNFDGLSNDPREIIADYGDDDRNKDAQSIREKYADLPED